MTEIKQPPTKLPGGPKPAGWVFKTLFILAVAGTFVGVVGAGGIYWYFSKDLPKIMNVADYRPPIVTRIVSAAAPGSGPGSGKETLMGEFFKNERRYLVPYEKIPEIVVKAFISAEDDKFFEHPGINVASMIRAAIANFRAGHVVQGGSTITQQVAKSLVLTSERSFGRKIKEIIVASSMERNLTKQQILYLYLNQIYLGHGAYGVEAACRTYFHHDASESTIAEAALLAGMPQAPGKYSPLLNPKRAKERQLYVLRRLYENKYITQEQMSEAAAYPLKVYPDEDLNKRYSAYLIEHLRRYLVEKYGEKTVYEDGLTVTIPTTPELTLAAAKNLREGLEAVDKRIGFRGAIEKLKTPEEVEKFLREYRISLIERKVKYQLLLPDGRLGPIEAMESAGIQKDWQLLAVGESYRAVVTSFNDKKKTANVMIGAVAAELPIEKMKWARPVKDEKNPQAPRPEPSLPSRVLSKGDVILVKVAAVSGDAVVVALDQEPQVQGAIFSMEVQTGYVLAMEGGYEFEKSEFNRAVQAQRQPGSAFKPIIYSAALERGYTPASILVDAPLVYNDEQLGKWKPGNFEEKFYGDTTFRQALIKSRNVPTIKIVQQLQVSRVIDYAKRLGMNAQFSPDLSISLGSAAISLMELTKTYALYPRLGRKVTPIFFTKLVDRDGRLLEEQKPVLPRADLLALPAPDPSAIPATVSNSSAPQASPTPVTGLDAYPPPNDPDQVMDPRVAYVMSHILKEVVNYGTGHEAKNLGRPAAGKTGTTNDYIDAWFMGFTPHVVTGTWVGFDSQKSIGTLETGARAALPIWLGYMREAVKNYADTDFVVPPGVVFASIDATTGKLTAPNSSSAIREAFIEGTEPRQTGEPGKQTSESTTDFFKEDVE